MGKLKDWCDKHYDIYHVDENGNYYDAEHDVIVNDCMWRPQSSIKWQLQQETEAENGENEKDIGNRDRTNETEHETYDIKFDNAYAEIVGKITDRVHEMFETEYEKIKRESRLENFIVNDIKNGTGIENAKIEIVSEADRNKTINTYELENYEQNNENSFDIESLFKNDGTDCRSFGILRYRFDNEKFEINGSYKVSENTKVENASW